MVRGGHGGWSGVVRVVVRGRAGLEPAETLRWSGWTGVQNRYSGGLRACLRARPRTHMDIHTLTTLTTMTEPAPRTSQPSISLVTVVEAYEGWWPLSVETLCRALVALECPLRGTPARELAARFDARRLLRQREHC